MEIRDILKSLREKNNFTQEQLAERDQLPDRQLADGKQAKRSQIQIR